RVLFRSAMNNAEMISTDMMLTEQGKTLGLNVKEKEVDPWVNSYLDLVMKEAAKKHSISIDELKRGGYRIVVNIDKQAQKIAYEEFKKDRYFPGNRSEEHTSELQSRFDLVCRLLLEKKKHRNTK